MQRLLRSKGIPKPSSRDLGEHTSAASTELNMSGAQMNDHQQLAVQLQSNDEATPASIEDIPSYKKSASVLVDYNNLAPEHAAVLATIDPRQDGSIKLSDVLDAVKKSNKRKKKLAISRRILIAFALVAMAQIAAIIGLTYTLLLHVKDTEVDEDTNTLVVKSRGSIIQTKRLLSTVPLSSKLPDHVLSRCISLYISGPGSSNITFQIQGYRKHATVDRSNEILGLLVHDGRHLYVEGTQVSFDENVQHLFEENGFRTVQYQRDKTGFAGRKRRLEKGLDQLLQLEGEGYSDFIARVSEDPDPAYPEQYYAEFTAMFPCVRNGADHCIGEEFNGHTKEFKGSKYAMSYGSLWVSGSQIREEYFVPTKTTEWKLVHQYEPPLVSAFQVLLNDTTAEVVSATQCSTNSTGFSTLHEQSSFLSKQRLPESTFLGYETLENGDEVRHFLLEEEGITTHDLDYYEMKSEEGTYVPRRMVLWDRSGRNQSNVIDFTMVQVRNQNLSMHFPQSSCNDNAILLETGDGQLIAVGYKTPFDTKEILHGGLPFDAVVSENEIWQAIVLESASGTLNEFERSVPGGYPFLKLPDDAGGLDSDPLLIDQLGSYRGCIPSYNSAGIMKDCVHLTSLDAVNVELQNTSALSTVANSLWESRIGSNATANAANQCDFRTDVSLPFYFGKASMSLPKPFTGGFLCKVGLSLSGKAIPIASVGGSLYLALRTDTEDWDDFQSFEVGGCVGVTLGCSVSVCGISMALSLSGCIAGGLRKETVVEEWETVERNVVTYTTTNCADWEWLKYRQLCGNPDQCSFCEGEQHCCKLYCCHNFAEFTKTYMDPPKYCCHTYPHYEKIVERVPKKWEDHITFYAKTAAYLQLGIAVFSFDMTVIPPLPHRKWKFYFVFSSSVTNKLCILAVCQYTHTASLGSSTAILDLQNIFDKEPKEEEKCVDAGPYQCLRLSEVEAIVRNEPDKNSFALRGGHCGMYCSYASGNMKCHLTEVSASTPISFSFSTHGNGQKQANIFTDNGRFQATCTDVGGDRLSCARKMSYSANESPNFLLDEITPAIKSSVFIRGGASGKFCSDKGPNEHVRCNVDVPSTDEGFCIVRQGSCTSNLAKKCPGFGNLKRCSSLQELFQAYTSNPHQQVTIQTAQCGSYCSHANVGMKCDRCEASPLELFTLKMLTPIEFEILTSNGKKCYISDEDSSLTCDAEPGTPEDAILLARTPPWQTVLPENVVYLTGSDGICTGSLEFTTLCDRHFSQDDLLKVGSFFDYLPFCISLV